jgi:hypothetical protein
MSEVTFENSEMSIRNIVFAYINFSNLQGAYLFIGKYRKAAKMEKKLYNLISAVKPNDTQVNEILKRLLTCGSINARLNAAVDCLKLNIYFEEAQLVLEDIAKNNDVEVLSIKAEKVLKQ